MSDFLANLSTKDKVIFLGGGALLLVFLFKAMTGNSSSSSAVPNGTDAAQQTANDTAAAQEALAADVADRLNDVEADQADALEAMSQAQAVANSESQKNLTDMFTAFGKTQELSLTAINKTVSSQIVDQNQTISTLQSLLNKMARTPVYTAAPVAVKTAIYSQTSGNPDNTKVKVGAGEVDYDVIRANTVTASGKTQAFRDAAFKRYVSSGYTDDSARQAMGPN